LWRIEEGTFLEVPHAVVRALMKRIGSPIRAFKAASTPRKLLFALGSVSFVAGVILLGIGVFSVMGGGNDGGPDNSSIARVVITPSPKPTIPKTATPSPTPVPMPPLGDGPYQIAITKIGVDAPVQEFGLDESAVPEVPTGDNAATVVAWYNFSAKPGTGSNAVFAGHVTWNGTAVFYNLTSLTPGDEIDLKGLDGTTLKYTVSEVFSVNPTLDPNAKDVMLPTPEDMLTIITCSGRFVDDPNDNVFGGNYDERLVVRAALQSVTPAGDAVAAVDAG
jgi:LPXTG-site transpeptidase (sortase) family protein